MIDLLAIAAHPDDVELHVSGTLLKTVDLGGTVAICDLTRGERGTRGSGELRAEETRQANRAMGIDEANRWNLGIPDGDIRITEENILSVVKALRHFRPRILLFPSQHDRHPDHENGHRLIREGWFNSGLTAVESEFDGVPQKPHRPELLLMYAHSWEFEPDLIVDISQQFERKMEAIAAYSSQFSIPGQTSTEDTDEPQTFISSHDFMEYIIARMRRWGFMVGGKYGEAFQKLGGPLKVDDLRTLL
ncbi:MAG: bacillithiol biosynthesis deacetylase BshB1 [Candidatus Kapaibacterium sp.]